MTALAVGPAAGRPATGAAWPAGRALVAACALLLLAAHVAALVLARTEAFRPGIAVMLAAGLPYALAAGLVLGGRARVSLREILLVAILLRLVVLPFDPTHSTDVFRYVWEGRIQAWGFSPYLHVPADPALAPLRDAAIWPRINRADYATTIYPPLAQAFFLIVTRVSETVTAMKLALVACEGVTAWALVRLLDLEGLPRDRLLLYAWSPLTAWEFAGGGHVDALMIACVALALLAARLGRGGWAGAALGCGVMVKFFPLVLAPALWRRWDLRFPLAMAGVIAAGYLVYGWGAGARVVGFAPTYASEEGIRDGSGFWLVRLARLASGVELPSTVYLGLAAAGLLALGAAAAFRPGAGLPRPRLGYALALALAATLVVSPQYPWYLAWLLPFACLMPGRPGPRDLLPGWLVLCAVLWLAASGFLLYWDYSRGVPWIADAVYGGALGPLLAAAARRAFVRTIPRITA